MSFIDFIRSDNFAIFVNFIQSIGIIVTLTATTIQLISYSKDQKISVVTRISERNDTLLQDIAANSKVFESFSKPFSPKKQNVFNDPRVAVMYRALNFFDELLYYRQKGSINKGTFELYQTTLRIFIDKPFAKSFWAHVQNEYNMEFQDMINKAIADSSQAQPKKKRPG